MENDYALLKESLKNLINNKEWQKALLLSEKIIKIKKSYNNIYAKSFILYRLNLYDESKYLLEKILKCYELENARKLLNKLNFKLKKMKKDVVNFDVDMKPEEKLISEVNPNLLYKNNIDNKNNEDNFKNLHKHIIVEELEKNNIVDVKENNKKIIANNEKIKKREKIDRYIIKGILGKGGMGTVYYAIDPFLDRPVAIKTLKITNSKAEKRFLKEGRIMAKIKHPNILEIMNIGRENDILYIVMNYINGKDMRKVIRENKIKLETWIKIMIDICKAVNYSHEKGILHRDLKPANIMLDKINKPYVMDFGLALDVEDEKSQRLTLMGAKIGTPAYMPPEQILGMLNEIDIRSDIYSLGVILYEMITKRTPFKADDIEDILERGLTEAPEPPSNIVPCIPSSLDKICLKAMQKEKENRYQNVSELIFVLNKVKIINKTSNFKKKFYKK